MFSRNLVTNSFRNMTKSKMFSTRVVSILYFQGSDHQENNWKKDIFFKRVIYPINYAYAGKNERTHYYLKNVESLPQQVKYVFEVNEDYAVEFESKLKFVVEDINEKWNYLQTQKQKDNK